MTRSPSPLNSRVNVIARETRLPLKGVVAVVIGNWLEFYDFLVFTFFAVMIGQAFFPGQSPIGMLLPAHEEVVRDRVAPALAPA